MIGWAAQSRAALSGHSLSVSALRRSFTEVDVRRPRRVILGPMPVPWTKRSFARCGISIRILANVLPRGDWSAFLELEQFDDVARRVFDQDGPTCSAIADTTPKCCSSVA